MSKTKQYCKNKIKMRKVLSSEKEVWNDFVKSHFPPVGAFMQTWEWGEFQVSLGRKIDRYFVEDGKNIKAAFTLVHHSLPFGFSYGYAPRGPVMSSNISDDRERLNIFKIIKSSVLLEHPKLIFLRFEPPIPKISLDMRKDGFEISPHYIQPRYNHTVELNKKEEEILAGFHPSTRSNINRAKNRGVTTIIKNIVTKEDCDTFFDMVKDTTLRTGGINIYPNRFYFDSLLKIVPSICERIDSKDLSLGAFFGYQNENPAAIHFVLFFGDTATYLFGASYTHTLNSKVSTYLHFSAMREANEKGFKFYDLGGVDEIRWPTLTNFKRQFKGKEFNYMGNIDIPVRPSLHRLYKLIWQFKSFIRNSRFKPKVSRANKSKKDETHPKNSLAKMEL